jgi:hypothetical protein
MFMNQNVRNGTVLQEHDCIATIAIVHAVSSLRDCFPFLFCGLSGASSCNTQQDGMDYM